MEKHGLYYTPGNEKYMKRVGKKKTKSGVRQEVMIINICSAHNCPSRKLGFCQLKNPNDCYALQAEKMYPDCKPFRDKQEKQWDENGAHWFISRIAKIQAKKRKKITHIRFDEAGDFKSSFDVLKMADIAKAVKKIGISTFTYTARRDLMEKQNIRGLFRVAPELVVNGSGFMVHNEYRTVSVNYKPKHKKEVWCRNNCHICKMCKKKLGITILAPERNGEYKSLKKRGDIKLKSWKPNN